jgi:hypothetical protein
MFTGMILIWRGSEASIPNGYHLCDGTAGTPDLRDRFVLGAGHDFNPDETGGSDIHSHTYSGGDHTHSLPTISSAAPGPGAVLDLTASTSGQSGVSGTTGDSSSMPPYYALCYIMKT